MVISLEDITSDLYLTGCCTTNQRKSIIRVCQESINRLLRLLKLCLV